MSKSASTSTVLHVAVPYEMMKSLDYAAAKLNIGRSSYVRLVLTRAIERDADRRGDETKI